MGLFLSIGRENGLDLDYALTGAISRARARSLRGLPIIPGSLGLGAVDTEHPDCHVRLRLGVGELVSSRIWPSRCRRYQYFIHDDVPLRSRARVAVVAQPRRPPVPPYQVLVGGSMGKGSGRLGGINRAILLELTVFQTYGGFASFGGHGAYLSSMCD